MQIRPFTSIHDLIRSPTSLRDCEVLARSHGIGRVLLKLENERPLGNFKVLGGTIAGLRVLERAAQDPAGTPARLLCASDGNHGLAVAAAARSAGAAATIFLHPGVDPARVRRIVSTGADVVTVPGTYDDAVEAAEAAAALGAGLLVPDTSNDPADPVVADVMAGYGLLCREVTGQLRAMAAPPLSHVFVQCGVGGLAAALADGLRGVMTPTGRLIVVEPETAACVGPALRSGRIERIPGDLVTSAEMLSCGLASAPAIDILRRHDAIGITVSEATLGEAVHRLHEASGIDTTPSGAAGLAGLLRAASGAQLRRRLGLSADSVVLLVITEGLVPTDA